MARLPVGYRGVASGPAVVKVTFNVKGYIDRRTPDLIARYERTQERRVESGWPVSLVSRLEPVGPDRQGGDGTITVEPRIWPATARAPFRLVRVR
jgi:hypothetical protein